jgi:hypothetical protein
LHAVVSAEGESVRVLSGSFHDGLAHFKHDIVASRRSEPLWQLR